MPSLNTGNEWKGFYTGTSQLAKILGDEGLDEAKATALGYGAAVNAQKAKDMAAEAVERERYLKSLEGGNFSVNDPLRLGAYNPSYLTAAGPGALAYTAGQPGVKVDDPRLGTLQIGAGHPYSSTVPGFRENQAGETNRTGMTIAGAMARTQAEIGGQNQRAREQLDQQEQHWLTDPQEYSADGKPVLRTRRDILTAPSSDTYGPKIPPGVQTQELKGDQQQQQTRTSTGQKLFNVDKGITEELNKQIFQALNLNANLPFDPKTPGNFASGEPLPPGVDPQAILDRASTIYRAHGNPAGAVRQALAEMHGEGFKIERSDSRWLPGARGYAITPGKLAPPEDLKDIEDMRGQQTTTTTNTTGTTTGTGTGGTGQPGQPNLSTALGGYREGGPGAGYTAPAQLTPDAVNLAVGAAKFGNTHPLSVLAVLNNESRGGQPVPPGAANNNQFGVMQMKPEALADVNRALGKNYTPQDIERDPRLATWLGAFYFGQQQQRFGGNDLLAAAAYNMGPNAVQTLLDANGGDPQKTLNALPAPVLKYVRDYQSYIAAHAQATTPGGTGNRPPPQPTNQPTTAQTQAKAEYPLPSPTDVASMTQALTTPAKTDQPVATQPPAPAGTSTLADPKRTPAQVATQRNARPKKKGGGEYTDAEIQDQIAARIKAEPQNRAALLSYMTDKLGVPKRTDM